MPWGIQPTLQQGAMMAAVRFVFGSHRIMRSGWC